MESLSSAAELMGINRETPAFPLPRETTWHSEGAPAFMRKENKSLEFK